MYSSIFKKIPVMPVEIATKQSYKKHELLSMIARSKKKYFLKINYKLNFIKFN